MSVGLVEAAVGLAILAAALVTLVLRDVLASIIVFGGYSLGMAILWVVFQAPDVGLTEAVVGAGVMTPLLLLAIAKMGTGEVEHRLVEVRWGPALAVALLALMLAATVPALPAVGDPAAPATNHVAPYYLEHAYKDTGFENVVTAILVGYRGFDTFGEVTVVFTAIAASLAVLRREVLM